MSTTPTAAPPPEGGRPWHDAFPHEIDSISSQDVRIYFCLFAITICTLCVIIASPRIPHKLKKFEDNPDDYNYTTVATRFNWFAVNSTVPISSQYSRAALPLSMTAAIAVEATSCALVYSTYALLPDTRVVPILAGVGAPTVVYTAIASHYVMESWQDVATGVTYAERVLGFYETEPELRTYRWGAGLANAYRATLAGLFVMIVFLSALIFFTCFRHTKANNPDYICCNAVPRPNKEDACARYSSCKEWAADDWVTLCLLAALVVLAPLYLYAWLAHSETQPFETRSSSIITIYFHYIVAISVLLCVCFSVPTSYFRYMCGLECMPACLCFALVALSFALAIDSHRYERRASESRELCDWERAGPDGMRPKYGEYVQTKVGKVNGTNIYNSTFVPSEFASDDFCTHQRATEMWLVCLWLTTLALLALCVTSSIRASRFSERQPHIPYYLNPLYCVDNPEVDNPPVYDGPPAYHEDAPAYDDTPNYDEVAGNGAVATELPAQPATTTAIPTNAGGGGGGGGLENGTEGDSHRAPPDTPELPLREGGDSDSDSGAGGSSSGDLKLQR